MTLSIRELIDTVLRGQIRIPAFQRGFVWEPERVAYLMDTLYKGYPFGTLLFWRTREQLRIERELGPFDLPPPKEDYPVDYVLDDEDGRVGDGHLLLSAATDTRAFGPACRHRHRWGVTPTSRRPTPTLPN